MIVTVAKIRFNRMKLSLTSRRLVSRLN